MSDKVLETHLMQQTDFTGSLLRISIRVSVGRSINLVFALLLLRLIIILDLCDVCALASSVYIYRSPPTDMININSRIYISSYIYIYITRPSSFPQYDWKPIQKTKRNPVGTLILFFFCWVLFVLVMAARLLEGWGKYLN